MEELSCTLKESRSKSTTKLTVSTSARVPRIAVPCPDIIILSSYPIIHPEQGNDHETSDEAVMEISGSKHKQWKISIFAYRWCK